VDESLFLSDRVALMTSGPEATLGQLIDVPFARPRERRLVLEDPRYDVLRDGLIDFLEAQAHPRPTAQAAESPEGLRFINPTEQIVS
jgi:nitrate/nitrite transport system ATP-binding protein